MCGDSNLGEQRPGLAYGVGFDHMSEIGRAFVKIIAFRQTSDNPVDAWICRKRRRGRRGIGRLAVVDEQYAVALRNDFHAMLKSLETAQGRPPLRLGYAKRLDQCDGNRDILQIVRTLQRRPFILP